MAGFDQLGLFSGSAHEKINKLATSSRKLTLDLQFLSAKDSKIDDIIRKFTKEVEGQNGSVTLNQSREDNFLPWFEQGFFALDVETTGLDAASNRVIELAMVPFNMPDEVKGFSSLYSIGETLPPEITGITGISDAMLKNQPAFAELADECIKLMRRASFVVAYNAKFDRPFLESEMARIGRVLPEVPWVDPFVFICELDRFKRGKKLADSAKRWGVSLENAHRATADAQAAGQLLMKMAEKIECHSLEELLAKQKILQWRNAHNMAELKRASLWSTNR